MLGAFALGLSASGLALAPALFPLRTYRAWCALRYGGAVPSHAGLLLTLAPAPAGLRGPAPGPWVSCVLRNVSHRPLRVSLPDRAGAEFSFESDPPAATPPWREVTQAVPVRRIVLRPGGAVALVCPLSRWLRLPPGQCRVRAKRLPLGASGGTPAISNWISLTGPERPN